VNQSEFTFVKHSGRSLVHLREPYWFTFVNVRHVFLGIGRLLAGDAFPHSASGNRFAFEAP
jgi:hypothetical protein